MTKGASLDYPLTIQKIFHQAKCPAAIKVYPLIILSYSQFDLSLSKAKEGIRSGQVRINTEQSKARMN